MSVVDWVLSAYEHDPDIPLNGRRRSRAVHAGGEAAPVPRAGKEASARWKSSRSTPTSKCSSIARLASWRWPATTPFCEILSLDKRAILIPRVKPRREQLLRARRAAALGLVRMLDPEGDHDPAVMASALRDSTRKPLPSERGAATMLDGLPVITDLVADYAGGTTFTKVRAAAL
jgi:hypothetical protein